MKKIYLDCAAATPVDKKVELEMRPYFGEKFGNTASWHSFGREARKTLEESRSFFASYVGAKSHEIRFTSSATESNNLALKGVAFANKKRGKHIIVSAIEHESVLNSAKWLVKEGFKIDYLSVNKYGEADLEKLKRMIKKDTILVSVMQANNEIGTMEPVSEIGKICRERGVYFHTDAAQTFGKVAIDVNKIKADLLTASSQKIYGPKGAALLYVREGVKIEPILHGGGHEFGLRASTINVPVIVGFREAAKISKERRKEENEKIEKLRDKLIEGIKKKIPEVVLNGHPKRRLNNNVNFSFKGIEGESVVMMLDDKGVAVSTGSACSSPSLEPSHVLLAIGLDPKTAQGSVRFSLGKMTEEKEIDYVIKVLPQIVEKLRKISPFK